METDTYNADYLMPGVNHPPAPLVSVVIPAYNAGEYILDAVLSVIDQTYQNWELIIVDDGSSDNTHDRVAQVLSDRRIRCKQIAHGGPARARNAGIEESSGSLIAFLDADDYWLPEKLTLQVPVFDSHPDVDLCGVHTCLVDMHRNVVSKIPYPEGMCYGPGFPRVLFASLVNMSTGVFRRGLFERHGTFDPNCKFAEDYELILRMARDAVFFVVPQVLAHIRKVGNTECISFVHADRRRDYVLDVIIPRFMDELGGATYIARSRIRELRGRCWKERADQKESRVDAIHWYLRSLWCHPTSRDTWSGLATRVLPSFLVEAYRASRHGK